MGRVRIPRFLHEAFGEEQSVATLAAILGFGIAGTAVLAWLDPAAFGAVAWWRSALAAILIFDVLAGAIANFTRGTNDFYAARPGLRWVFIAVHVHLPLVALLLGVDWWPALVAWAYTVAAASVVNAAGGRVPVGGVALGAGLLLVMLLPFASTVVAATAAMFVLKVVFAFGVDHYAPALRGPTRDR